MEEESVKDFYDRQYRSHREQPDRCLHSLNNLAKARRRVAGVLRGFRIQNCVAGAEILDVGSGLGFYTKALALTGASVTGVDFSKSAVEAASATFPECRFTQGAWPDDIPAERTFDLIWTINFSLINTFDINVIQQRLVSHAMTRLRPGGCLVIGWNTDFSGRKIHNYSHWPVAMLQKMKQTCGFSAPLVIEGRSLIPSWLMIRTAFMFRKSIPIFMVLRK